MEKGTPSSLEVTMMSTQYEPPAMLPVLSRGKHRNPRRGACFMEFASYLAGERWSDHPACTHPLLGALARMVNDTMSDDRRNELAVLIPSVIGQTSDDPRVDVRITLRAATTALPVASADRQHVLAVAVLSSERILAQLDHLPSGELTERSRLAMERTPAAARWARDFVEGERTTLKGYRRYAAPTAVRCAVEGIAQACVHDPDTMLYDLLADTIDECGRWFGRRGDGLSAAPSPLQPARSGPRPAFPVD
jgi:hypothetical protein